MRDLISEYQNSLIASINKKLPEQYDNNSLLIRKRTPDNNSCGDIINKFNPNTKVVEIIRNPCTLYAAEKEEIWLALIPLFTGIKILHQQGEITEKDQVITIQA